MTDENPIVCTCHLITRDEIRQRISDGCHTFIALRIALRVTTGCGGCIREVEKILDESLKDDTSSG